MARGQIIFQFEGLFEGYSGFLVVFGFIVDEAEVVEAGWRGFDAGGDFETVDSVTILLLFGVENAEPVVGGGVFLIYLEDGQESFFGTQETVFAHALVGYVP